LWQRSQEIETRLDDGEWLLDLAALADGRLDDDESARVVALIANDADAAADMAAARLLASVEIGAADPRILARAATLVVPPSKPEAVLIAFPGRAPSAPPWFSAARWSGLAAAIVLAGWLGFDLGSGISKSPAFGRAGDDVAASETFDSTPVLLRDFTENSQI
jgi:anti-sigma factor RsiW